MNWIIIKSSLLLFTALFVSGFLTIKTFPLKGTYSDKPYEVISDKTFEQAWSDVIDIFATKGLSIKLIDKSSGLLISEKTSFLNNYTFEDNKGKPENPDAYIVLEKLRYFNMQYVNPDKITGEWNIRIKDRGNGQTTISVNLTNIDATLFVGGTNDTPSRNLTFNGKSTGKFEELIISLIQ